MQFTCIEFNCRIQLGVFSWHTADNELQFVIAIHSSLTFMLPKTFLQETADALLVIDSDTVEIPGLVRHWKSYFVSLANKIIDETNTSRLSISW